MTYRQIRAWAAWKKLDLNRPGKIEWALARVAAEACFSNPQRKSPRRIDLSAFLANIQHVDIENEKEWTEDDQTQMDKASTIGQVGGDVVRVQVSREEALKMAGLDSEGDI